MLKQEKSSWLTGVSDQDSRVLQSLRAVYTDGFVKDET